MRLIDADAEIVKIEDEIKRIEEKIERWRQRKQKGDTAYETDIYEEIKSLQRNIAECRIEIRILKNYETVPDDALKKMMEEQDGGTGWKIKNVKPVLITRMDSATEKESW